MEATTTPDLTSYDIILVNSSAGKDSQATLDYVAELASEAGVLDRIVVVHADLGRVEWAGTRELAEAQAQTYGFRFETVSRKQGDLLVQVEARGMWPSSTARYCTSDHKTSQVARLMTQLVNEKQAGLISPRQVRILNILGIRADESPARSKKVPFENEKRASNGRRHVDRWFPIFTWSEADVWERIGQAPTDHHPAYDLGMPRLSCCFCVLASKPALVLAAQHNPELAQEYLAVEERIQHTFRQDLPMAAIVAEAQATPVLVKAEGWSA